jgi:predicted RNA-binding Zn-ribbon protein involved in translation (DUF1610 family)
VAKKQQAAANQNADQTADKPESAAAAASFAGLGLDDAELSAAVHGDNGPPLVGPQQGTESRPSCPMHNVLMVAYASRESATHYRCPVAGCTERAKKARPKVSVPAAPQLCHDRACVIRGEGQPAAMEVVANRSSASHLKMVCPRCGQALDVPRPEFGAFLKRQRDAINRRSIQEAAEDLSER